MNRLTFLKTLLGGIFAAPAAAKAIQAAPVAVGALRSGTTPIPTAAVETFGLTFKKIMDARQILEKNQISSDGNMWMIMNPKQFEDLKAALPFSRMTATEIIGQQETFGMPAMSPEQITLGGCHISTDPMDPHMHRSVYGTSITIPAPGSEDHIDLEQQWHSSIIEHPCPREFWGVESLKQID